ncbi:Alpha/Beta hydrolase protein [Zychaea mexicana]|uniref:Alpha/Beta hydrolase protein n=1 Tax=Zychaea mexicana TaxID=64656 RepID=UPI0022FE8B73|nr:Alpha/Beta hydrolase protein [Zychaea mexicana]KAI9488079.1 Alpha/Beta hydrolase protein [Zychaea mexicana]
MLAFITSLPAAAYVLNVLVSGLLTALAFHKQVTQEVFGGNAFMRKFLIAADSSASTLSELPLHVLALKWITIQLTHCVGGFGYTLAWLLSYVDYVILGFLLMLFVESWKEDAVVEEAIKDLAGGDPADTVDSIMSANNVRRILNPIWTPKDIVMYPNITYATNEETTEAIELTNDYDQPRKMALDIYKWSKAPKNSGLRPVLVHIHGGAWRMGGKGWLYPHEKTLVTEENWLVVNIGYRLAPKNAYPTHLIDVKRALRYLKKCISAFGGDPNLIVLSGDSAGGHLAAMAAFTANDPQYQPGFEDADTTVKGVITINGALDVQSDKSRGEYFSHKVALKDKVDPEFLGKHSPVDLVDKANQDGLLVPFLVITGSRDAIVDCSIGRRFKKNYDLALGEKANTVASQCTLVELPAAHHICHLSWSPRSIYVSRLIQVWCQLFYNKHK